MADKPKRVKYLISIFDNGDIHIQENHEPTTTDIPDAGPADDPGTPDDGGDTPTKPPGNP